MIYFICGHRGCGKNYLANQLVKNTSMTIIDTGPLIRRAYAKFDKENLAFGEWMKKNEKKYGENFSNELICKMTSVNPQKNYIVIGYRSLNGIKYFQDFFHINEYKILFIDGDFELFRSNYNSRENLSISKEEYAKIIEIENLMGIQELRDFSKKNSKVGRYYYKAQNDDSIYNSIMIEMNKSLEEGDR